MENLILFPNKGFSFFLKKKYSFSFENNSYNSIFDFILNNSKAQNSKNIVLNDDNILRAEKGILELFKQDKQFRDELLATKDKYLGYAMPADENWGIGFKKEDPSARNKNNWKKNHLGNILLKVRKAMIENPNQLAIIETNQFNLNKRENAKISYDWRIVSKNDNKKFTYFWRAESPFSQHHPTRFNLDGQTFNCAEQYYMYMKTVVFHDDYSKSQIMNTTDPMKQKSIGRKVLNFDSNHWDKIARDIVFKANIAKFTQSSRLLKLLLSTKNTALVEASPKDNKWGVGLEAHDVNIFRQVTWKGTNWLGETLDRVREHLIEKGDLPNYEFEYLKPDCFLSFSKSSSPFHYTHLCVFEIDGIPYINLNHYLVHMAAELFNDVKAIGEVKSCMDNKKLDDIFSKINSYVGSVYNQHLDEYLLKGNYLKFTQNKNLLDQLLDTAGCVLVFDDSDKLLGTGNKGPNDGTMITRDNWYGKNLLGYSLTYLRDEYLKTNGKYSPQGMADYSRYKGINTVPFLQSQNNKKRVEANNIGLHNSDSNLKVKDISKDNSQIIIKKNSLLEPSELKGLDMKSFTRGKQMDPFENGEKAFFPQGDFNTHQAQNQSEIYTKITNNILNYNFSNNISKNSMMANKTEANNNMKRHIQDRDVSKDVMGKQINFDDSQKGANAKHIRQEKHNLSMRQDAHIFDNSLNKTPDNDFETQHFTKSAISEYDSANCKSILDVNSCAIMNEPSSTSSKIGSVDSNYSKQPTELANECNFVINDDNVSTRREEICHTIIDNKEYFMDENESTVFFDKNSKFSPFYNNPFKMYDINFPTFNHFIYWKKAEFFKLNKFKEDILGRDKSITLGKFDRDFKNEIKEVYDSESLKWNENVKSILKEGSLIMLNSNEEYKRIILMTKKKKVPTATLR